MIKGYNAADWSKLNAQSRVVKAVVMFEYGGIFANEHSLGGVWLWDYFYGCYILYNAITLFRNQM